MEFQKKPVVIGAMCWLGGNMTTLDNFCGRNWGRADAVGSESWPSDIPDAEQVMVFNSAEQTWLPVPVGWWIIRGIEGELYPCKPDIFVATYQGVWREQCTPEPTVEDGIRLLRKMEACSGDHTKLILLKHFMAEAYRRGWLEGLERAAEFTDKIDFLKGEYERLKREAGSTDEESLFVGELYGGDLFGILR